MLKWFKLLLQQEDVNPWFPKEKDDNALSSLLSRVRISRAAPADGDVADLERTAALIKELRLTTVDVVTNFLKNVKEVAMKDLEASYPSSKVAQSGIEFILTIPAIWTDLAKSKVIQTAENAGLGRHRENLQLCTEPEAAAVHTLRAIQPHELQVGQSIVICDAGGGTCVSRIRSIERCWRY